MPHIRNTTSKEREMAILSDTPDVMIQIIHATISARVAEVYEEEIEKAKSAVQQRIKKELGEIALSVLSHYSVITRGNDIIITVRNEV